MGKTKWVARVVILSIMISLLSCGASSAAGKKQKSDGNSHIVKNAQQIKVTSGSSVTGNIKDYYKPDLFKFKLKKGSIMEMKFYGYSSAHKVSFIFYDSDGIKNNRDLDGVTPEYKTNLGYRYYTETYYLAKGTNYLKVTGLEKYKVVFKKTTPYETVKEPNDLISTAMKVNNGEVYKGLIATNSTGTPGNFDRDFFQVPEAGTYHISFENTMQGENGFWHSRGYLCLYQFDNQGDIVKDFGVIQKGQSKQVVVDVSGMDRSYFKVAPSGETGTGRREGMYRISFTKQ